MDLCITNTFCSPNPHAVPVNPLQPLLVSDLGSRILLFSSQLHIILTVIGAHCDGLSAT